MVATSLADTGSPFAVFDHSVFAISVHGRCALSAFLEMAHDGAPKFLEVQFNFPLRKVVAKDRLLL